MDGVGRVLVHDIPASVLEYLYQVGLFHVSWPGVDLLSNFVTHWTNSHFLTGWSLLSAHLSKSIGRGVQIIPLDLARWEFVICGSLKGSDSFQHTGLCAIMSSFI